MLHYSNYVVSKTPRCCITLIVSFTLIVLHDSNCSLLLVCCFYSDYAALALSMLWVNIAKHDSRVARSKALRALSLAAGRCAASLWFLKSPQWRITVTLLLHSDYAAFTLIMLWVNIANIDSRVARSKALRALSLAAGRCAANVWFLKTPRCCITLIVLLNSDCAALV